MRRPIADIEAFLAACFAAAGLAAVDAQRVSEALLDADVSGLSSHGVLQAPLYIERLRRGSISAASQAEIVSDRDAAMVLEAGGMFGHLVGDQAMDLAIAKSRAFGAGIVAVRNAFHFGAAGRYVRQASAAGCIGVALCNTRPLMPAPGGAMPLVGNNPLAIGLPAAEGPDFLLDMAMSEAALAKIRSAEGAGRPIPAGWALDQKGNPTTDATAALRGMLLPAGGAKGFGLALAVDLLASLLSEGPGGGEIGSMYGDLDKPFLCSLLFLAIDIAHFTDIGTFASRAGSASARIRAAPPARVPGDSAAEARKRNKGTITIDPSLRTKLNDVATQLGIDLRLR